MLRAQTRLMSLEGSLRSTGSRGSPRNSNRTVAGWSQARRSSGPYLQGPFALLSLGSRDHHDAELAAFLHRDERVVRAQHQVHEMIRKLLVEAGKTGDVRDDVSPDELAGYCPQRPRGRRQTALEGRCVSVLFAMMFISPL